MDVREKLVKLVHNARINALWHNAQKPDEYITDMLMEGGVTVQEWIPVSPCSCCGYGGKHLDAPPCTTCPAHPKEHQPNAPLTGWISVKDRLPEEKVNCIVHYKHAYFDNDDYWTIGICFYDGEKFQINPAYKVTHWMPMPHPPKGE